MPAACPKCGSRSIGPTGVTKTSPSCISFLFTLSMLFAVLWVVKGCWYSSHHKNTELYIFVLIYKTVCKPLGCRKFRPSQILPHVSHSAALIIHFQSFTSCLCAKMHPLCVSMHTWIYHCVFAHQRVSVGGCACVWGTDKEKPVKLLEFPANSFGA